MRAVFSSGFKTDVRRAQAKYRQVSERLASAFLERVTGQTRQIIRWQGGDHVGPHGFQCRRTRPFPYYVYYSVEDDTAYFLGLIHERRHPDYLKKRLTLKQ